MSLTQRVKQGFLRLPLSKKMVLISSGALMVSTVLPWYDERNSFGIGDTYLGVQGPLFMVGLLVLGFGAISFFNLFLPLMGRQFFNLRRKGGSVALVLGAQSLLLLGVANSVFYHPEFGLSLTNKGTRFGMMVALGAVGLMMLSGWMTRRKESEEPEELQMISEPMDVEEPEMIPVQSAVSPVFSPMPTPPSYSPPSRSVPLQTSMPSPAPSEASSTVDPLTLDAKTRYRLMKSQQRFSSGARGNLWGGGNGSAYGGHYGSGSYGSSGHYGASKNQAEQSMDF